MLPLALRPPPAALAAALALLAALPAAGALAESPIASDLLARAADCDLRVIRDAPPLHAADLGLGLAPRDHPVALEECTGQIRPGARMTSPAGCTFNFVFTDAQANLYIGTAGHCVGSVGQRVSAAGIAGSFGSVAFRRLGGGTDFALVKVDPARHGLVNPTLCSWGGPIGPDPNDGTLPRSGILEYGWGFFTQGAAYTRTRAHVERSDNGQEMVWLGLGSGGDSGAPVVTHGGHAAGIHTFGVDNVGPGWGFTGEGGPTFANILAAGRTAIPSLQLVPGDPTNLENALRGATYS